jgi:hypothetical protein
VETARGGALPDKSAGRNRLWRRWQKPPGRAARKVEKVEEGRSRKGQYIFFTI